MIVIAGTAIIQPKHRDEAVAQAQQMVTATEAETGCISYRIYMHPTEHNTFFIFEEWETPEALALHFQTPHLQTFSAYLASALSSTTNIKRYDVSAVSAL